MSSVSSELSCSGHRNSLLYLWLPADLFVILAKTKAEGIELIHNFLEGFASQVSHLHHIVLRLADEVFHLSLIHI